MADVSPDVLRDTFTIWIYATVTCLDSIVNGTTTSAQILNTLEIGRYIKAGDSNNKKTVEEVCGAIQGDSGSYDAVQQGIKSLSVLSIWTGPSPHPKLSELSSVFIAPRP